MSIIKLSDNPSNGLKMISLFAGCGGSSMGYRAAGYDVRLAVEWDKGAADLYRNNLPGTHVYQGDIAELTPEMIVELSGLGIGELDVLDGSPPCQGFSSAGVRDFHDDRNQLFNEYVRILEALMPRAFIMENVAGVVRGKMKIIFSEMTRKLKAAGYRVSCRKLNAWWYGVPQNRERLFWVGIREDIGIDPSHPKPILKRPISVQQALGLSLIDANFYNHDHDWKPVSGTLRGNQKPRTIMHTGTSGFNDYDGFEKKGKRKYPATEVMATQGGARRPTLQHTGSFTFPQNVRRDGKEPDHVMGTQAAIRPPSIAKIIPGYNSDLGFFGEDLDKHGARGLDKESPALTGQMSPRIVGSTPTSDGQATRYLTIEESKIIQSFPDWFEMQESDYRYIGNSVPPLMAKAVGSHVAELLQDE